ncbi:MAG: glutathione S-transferase [Proteobacteria bacterium]|nr:glutathione S-transferase [Pseudomonadota bacterium]
MKLFFSPASPFVRKVMVCAIERGIGGLIEKLPSAAHPINQDASIKAHNPTGKVPTLITEDGKPVYDSRVICEYLDAIGAAPKLFPAVGKERWPALVLHSAADELLDAALLARYESVARPEALRWEDWHKGQLTKIGTTITSFSTTWIDHLENKVDIGTIAVGCALGYLDFRFPDIGWRNGNDRLAAWYAKFSERPSMKQTAPTA